MDLFQLPPLPQGKAFLPFQIPLMQQMLYFYITRHMKGVYNGCDRGLGKTIKAIALANFFEARRTIIVCPASVRANWEEEIREFSTIPNPRIRTIYNSRDILPNFDHVNFIVCSYAMLIKPAVFKAIIKDRFDFCIFDEAHNLLTLHSQKTKACIQVWNNSKRGNMLSGTPIRRCTTDLFPSLHILMPEDFHSFTEFAEEYAKKRTVPWGSGSEYYDGKNLDQLKQVLRQNFFVRISKDEALPDLPKKNYQKIVLDVKLSSSEKFTKEEEEAILEAFQDPAAAKPRSKSVRDTRHVAHKRQELAIKKVDSGLEFILDFIDCDQPTPIVIYAFYHLTIDYLAQQLAEFNPVILDGRTPGKQKQKAIDDFCEGRTSVFIGQIQSAGVGIDGLQHRASNVIYVETSYDPSDIEQSVDRLCRYGQTQRVNAYFFCARDTVEENVFKIVKSKQTMIEKVI